MKFNVQGSLFALILGALAALPPISIDMALPALGSIAHTLHVTPGMAQLTLSFFMAGFALSPIVYGPFSDRYGRRPMLLLGLALFTLGGDLAGIFPPDDHNAIVVGDDGIAGMNIDPSANH